MELVEAVFENDLEKVRLLLKAGVDPNFIEDVDDGFTPLMWQH